MGQRKLTDEELQTVMETRWQLRKVANFGCTSVHASIMIDELSRMGAHCTTDGKPYVEPQPEIGDGYRVATEADKGRRDRQGFFEGVWVQAAMGICFCGIASRVPVDRIPTDKDAKQRPAVMVRNNERMKWKVVKLIMVAEKAEGMHFPFVTIDSLRPDCWACCRFPYPGELD